MDILGGKGMGQRLVADIDTVPGLGPPPRWSGRATPRSSAPGRFGSRESSPRQSGRASRICVARFRFFKKPCHWRRQSVRQTRAKIILPVKVVDSKHQRLGGDLGVGHLKVERLIEHGIQCLAVNFGLELFLLVGQ